MIISTYFDDLAAEEDLGSCLLRFSHTNIGISLLSVQFFLDRVGLDLRTPAFSHGQLYVALSRVTNMGNLTVLLPLNGDGRTENIVYPEVLYGLY